MGWQIRRSVGFRTLAVAISGLWVIAAPLDALAQLGRSQRAQQNALAQLLGSRQDAPQTTARTRAAHDDDSLTERAVLPVPLVPTKLEWVAPASGGPDPWVLFDGRAKTAVATATNHFELRVGLSAPTQLGAFTLLGPARGSLTVRSEDATGTHPIDGWTDIAIDVTAGEWKRIPTTAASKVTQLVVEWTARDSTGPSEIGLWGFDVPRARGDIDPAVADRILAGAQPGIATAMAVPTQARIARVDLGAGAPTNPAQGVAFHVALGSDPRSLSRAFLVYELSGIGHWTEALRQINELDVRGGVAAQNTSDAIRDGGVQVEEIAPSWLKPGDNEVRFLPPVVPGSPGYNVRNVRIVGMAHAGFIETRLDPKPRGTATADVAFASLSQPHEATFDLLKPSDGRLAFSAKGTHAKPLTVDLHGLDAGWHHVDLGGLPATSSLSVVLDTPTPKHTLREGADGATPIVSEIGASASPRDVADRRLVISYPLHGECIDHSALVRGFVVSPSGESVSGLMASGRAVADGALGRDGSFAFSEPEPASKRGQAWALPVEARLSNGTVLRSTLAMQPCVDTAKAEDGAALKEDEGAPFAEFVRAGEAKTFSFAGTKLEIPAGAVDQDVRITVRPLVADQVRQMSPGIANVSPNSGAFRFGPHGLKFKKPIKVTLPYDPHSISRSSSEHDVFAFYYDEAHAKWSRIGRFGVAAQGTLTSLTDHFTDFINATIAMPNEAGPQSFNPNEMKGIKLADPGAGLDLIAPPQANASGSANLSYPLELPPGRNGVEPSLAFTYSSGAGNGWLGVGWSLPISAIEIDTRFGVPKYDGTERYLLDGAELTPSGNDDNVYVRRVEGRFDKIVRDVDGGGCVTGWTITDKNGTISQYGGAVATLADPGNACHAFRWGLSSVTDTYGNGMSVSYFTDPPESNAGGVELYPMGISYTSSTKTPNLAVYGVAFAYDDGLRRDVMITARPGFERRTRFRLDHVDVSYSSELIRRYQVNYAQNTFDHFYKSLVHSLVVYGQNGAAELDEHAFDYNSAPTSDGTIEAFGQPIDWGLVQTGVGVERIDDGLSKTYQENTGVSVSVGVGFPFLNISVSGGGNGGTDDTQLSLFDLNGDGLPDSVDDTGNATFNLLNPSLSIPNNNTLGHLQYASVAPLPVDSLNHGSQVGWNVGVTGTASVFSIGADYTRSTSKDDTIVSDIDGDGFADLVKVDGGQLHWFRNDGTGHFVDEGTSSTLTNVALGGGDDYTQAAMTSGLRRIAPLVRWTAPFAGTVTIADPVQKAAPGGNGVVATIYENGSSVLWQRKIDPDDTSTCVPSGSSGCGSGITLGVSTGDRLYFTIAPYDDGSTTAKEYALETQHNDVMWSPSITYQGVDTTQREPYGPPIYVFSQQSDFRLAGKPELRWQASSDGKVVITGDVTKRPTSDSVTVRILQQDKSASTTKAVQTYSLSAGADSVALSVPLVVAAQDQVSVQVISDTPIDPGQIQWRPQITYTKYCKDDPPSNSVVCGEPVSCAPAGCTFPADPSPNSPIPNDVITQDLQPQFLLAGGSQSGSLLGIPQLLPAAPSPSYVATSSGSVTLSGSITISGTGSPDNAYVLVQGVDALYSKTVVPLAATQTVNLNVVVPTVNAGDQVFVTVYSDDVLAGDVSWNSVQANGAAFTPNVRWRDPDFEKQLSPPFDMRPSDPMSGGFHRWWTGFINAELGFTESNIFFPNNLDGTLIENPSPYELATPQWQGTPSVMMPLWAGPSGTYIAPGAFGTTRGGSGGAGAGGLDSLRSTTTWNVDLDAKISAGIVAGASITRGESFSTADFFDFNGDRRPDSITPQGIAFGDGKGGFTDDKGNYGAIATDITNLPSDALRHIQHRSFNATAGGSNNIALTNRVDSKGRNLDTLTLGFNIGTTYSMSMNQADWIDVNGDGLPDYVTRDQNSPGQFNVQLNHGYGLSAPIPWTTKAWANQKITGAAQDLVTYSTSLLDGFSSVVGVDQVRTEDTATNNISVGGGINVGNVGASGGAGFAYGTSRSLVDLIDVNGDGLPDQVMKDPQHYQTLLVKLNLGDHFDTAEIPWALPDWTRLANIGPDLFAAVGQGDVDDVLAYRRSEIYNVNVSFNVCFFICIGGSVYHSWGNGWQHSQFEDVDGDGYVDQVLKVAGTDYQYPDRDHLWVKLNQTGKTNLLVAVHRPLGGTIALDYGRAGNLVRPDQNVDMPTNKWVMTKVDVDDGLGNHYVRGITYDPSGFYDRVEREDYGFAKVTTTREDNSTLESDYINHDFYREGAVSQTIEADQSGKLFEVHQFTYDDPGQPPPLTGSFFPAEVKRVTNYYEGTTNNINAPGVTTYETRAWDSVGNLTDMTDTGDVGKADDVVYHVDYDPTLAASHIFRPTEVTAKDTSGNVLRDRRATYDSSGGVATLTNIVTGGSDPNGNPYQDTQATWTFTRDAYGNVIKSTDPRSYEIDLTYDSQAETYDVQTADSFGYTSSSVPNYLFGTVASTTDENGNMEVRAYDQFGRLKAVYAPVDIGSSEPTLTFQYSEGAGLIQGPAWAITAHKDVQHPGDPIETTTFADGLERVIQTKKDLERDNGGGTTVGMTVSGAIEFDARGRVKKSGQPVFDTSDASMFVGVSMINPTEFAYDIQDRPLSVETPDGALTTTAYGFDTLDSVTRLSTTVRDANVNAGGALPGMPEETFHDVRGSVLTVLQNNHLGNGVTPILTRYAYDPLEQLLSVTDAKGNITSAQYDTVGRMIALSSPDAGLTTYQYDLSGNLGVRQTAKLRAKSQSIQYAYDFNRLKQITYPTSKPVQYFYGDPGDLFNAAGRIKEEDSEAGVKTYEYDTLGNVAVQRWTLNSIAHDKTYDQSIGYDYDAFGRLLTIHFPDDETVNYGYDAGGNVTTAVGVDSYANTTPYLLHVGYDEFEQRTRLVAGNGIQTTYSYDTLTRRLSQINASTTARPFQQMRYKYDLVGNIDQIQNLVPYDDSMNGQVRVGPMTQNFTYDDLYQLKTGDGVYQESSKPGTFSYGLSFSYDAIGNVLQKTQTSTDSHGKAVSGQQYSSSYTYGGPRPHAPTEVDETPVSPNKPLPRTLSYDESGNQTGWDFQGDNRTVDWNEEDRISAIHDNGKETLEALYDGAGDRAVKERADGGNHETFYFGPNMTSRDGQAPSKHIFLGAQRIASKQSPADSGNQAPEVFYFHDDHLGSTNFMTNSEHEIAAHEEYFPTGELWVDETSDPLHVQTPYLFTGKALDTESGLYYFGARYYDPHLGIWSSPDPAISQLLRQGGGPERLWVYAYCRDNPLVYFDPDGRDPWYLEVAKSQLPPAPRVALAYFRGGRPAALAEAKQLLHQAPQAAFPVISATITQLQEQKAAVDAAAHHDPVGAGGHAVASVIPGLLIALDIVSEGGAGGGGPAPAPLRFTQITASANFSVEGKFAGKTITQVAEELRAGSLKSSDVPVEFINRGGNRLIVNTRSSLALKRAGIPERLWTLVDRTGQGDVEANITERLTRNGLSNEGSPTLRITGLGQGASNVK